VAEQLVRAVNNARHWNASTLAVQVTIVTLRAWWQWKLGQRRNWRDWRWPA
jgi:hypothetical protein